MKNKAFTLSGIVAACLLVGGTALATPAAPANGASNAPLARYQPNDFSPANLTNGFNDGALINGSAASTSSTLARALNNPTTTSSSLEGSILKKISAGSWVITDWKDFCSKHGKYCAGQLTPDLQALAPIVTMQPMVNNTPNTVMFDDLATFVHSGGNFGLDTARVALVAVPYVAP